MIDRWAERYLFFPLVALFFQPEGLAAFAKAAPPGAMDALLKDRMEMFAKGGNLTRPDVAVAKTELPGILESLDAQLAAQPYLSGDRPTLIDYTVYHPIWFLRKNPYNAPLIEAHPNVVRWFDSIAAFGHGRVIESDGEAALAEARLSEPRKVEPVVIGVDAKQGDSVSVTPTDYGQVPVEGELVRADPYEFAVRRTTYETGTIVTHFPRTGFELKRVDPSNQESV